ncbi:MAG: tetratricopeptide repeat protein [Bacteroidota bacterium]
MSKIETNRIPVAAMKPDRSWIWFCLAIAVLSVTLYVNTLQNSYALDDKGIITLNKITEKGFSGIPELLTTSYWKGINLRVMSYRPLSPVTFAIEIGIWGKNPMVGHFFNMLFYMATGLLMLFFLKRLFGKIDPEIPPVIAFLATMLFLAHPIHTEVVANIKGRDSLFEFFFLLLSAHLLLRYLETARTADLVLSVVSFFPALLSKESAITYVIMVPVLLILFDSRTTGKKFTTTLFFLAPVVMFLLLYFLFSEFQSNQRLHIMDNSLMAVAPAASIWATKFLILGKYLSLLVFPHPLVYDYSYNQIPLTGFTNPMVWVSLLVYLSATLFLLVILYKKLSAKTVGPAGLIIAFSVAWFIMGFIVSSNLFLLIGSTMGERFMYTPSLGFILLVVYGLYRLVKWPLKKKKFGGPAAIVLYLFCCLLLTGYLVKTINRNGDWKDDLTLFSNDLKYLRENAKANDFLANIYQDSGNNATDPAMKNEYYRKAIELKEKAVSINPRVPEILHQLGYLYGNTGQFEKAISTYKYAIELNPDMALNYIQVGKAYGMIRKFSESIDYLKQAEKISPDDADLLCSLGITYAQTGDAALALAYFEKAHARNPSDKQINNFLNIAKSQINQNNSHSKLAKKTNL